MAKLGYWQRTQQTAFESCFSKLAPGNANKIQNNTIKQVEREGAIDHEHKKRRIWKVNEAAAKVAAKCLSGKIECPREEGRERTQIDLRLKGMVAAVEVRSRIEGGPKLTGRVTDCDAALEALIVEASISTKHMVKGLQKTVLPWRVRADGVILYLHPDIYDNTSRSQLWRLDKVASALGVGFDTARRWFSLQDKTSKANIERWLPLVNGITWKEVARMFRSDWTDQFKLDDSAKVTDQLDVYTHHVQGSKETFLSKFTPCTTNTERRSMAKKNKHTHLIKKTSKRVGRSDAGNARKYFQQEAFVIKMVMERWNEGDPIGKIALKDEVLARDDCQPGSNFYKQYFDPTKQSALSGWTNWLNRVLKQEGWSLRRNSIGQTVPKNWRKLAEANAARIRKRFRDEGVEVVINADQTFVQFFMEEEEVIVPTGVKRVGRNIKASVKKGFTLMVACNMETSNIEAPFAVFNGTKINEAKHPERTLAHKYRGWRHSGPRKTGFMAFQPKHWFDKDITIMWFDWILDQLYPGKKVGISIDRAPAHCGGKVQAYIKRRTDEGRLVEEDIDGGLTSVLQVCDLAANKEVKDLIKAGYLKHRTSFIRAERARHPDEPNRRINMKVPIATMMEIIEEAIHKFNNRQRETESIRKNFISAGQNPWRPCEDEFKVHLDKLSNLPLYGGCKCNNAAHGLEVMNLQSRTPVLLSMGRGAVVEVEDEPEEKEMSTKEAIGKVTEETSAEGGGQGVIDAIDVSAEDIV